LAGLVEFSEFSVNGQKPLVREQLSNLSVSNSYSAKPAKLRDFKIRVTEGNRKIRITFGPTAASSKLPIRFRYHLAGYETAWHDIDSSMRFVIHFWDAQRQPVGSADFPAHGDSPGWTGKVESSLFVERRETVIVPDRCKIARIWIPSGGNPDTVGIYVIGDIKATKLSQGPHDDEKLLLFDDFESGKDLDNPLGVPDGWVRDGTSLAIAKIVRTGPGRHSHALALIDDSPDKFGAWDTWSNNWLSVKSGEKLLLEWKEMYSIGANRAEDVEYRDLPVGEYRFIVQPVSVFGQPAGEESVLPFQVVPPLYRQRWFLGMVLLVSAGALAGMARYVFWRRLQRKLERMEFQRTVERERSRIAQDIHDDLGTRLTRVSLLSEAARRDAGLSAANLPTLDEISSTAKEMTRALDEIVWAVDPQQDSLDSLVCYLEDTTQDMMRIAGIKCRFSFPTQLPAWTILPDVRHHTFLAFNEALNNVAKHSQATEVKVDLELGPGYFILSLADNGRGFNLPSMAEAGPEKKMVNKPQSSGLLNLRRRLKEINGKIEIYSRPGSGTKISFWLPIRDPDSVNGRKFKID
jgi:signal transduction histidine kinase